MSRLLLSRSLSKKTSPSNGTIDGTRRGCYRHRIAFAAANGVGGDENDDDLVALVMENRSCVNEFNERYIRHLSSWIACVMQHLVMIVMMMIRLCYGISDLVWRDCNRQASLCRYGRQRPMTVLYLLRGKNAMETAS